MDKTTPMLYFNDRWHGMDDTWLHFYQRSVPTGKDEKNNIPARVVRNSPWSIYYYTKGEKKRREGVINDAKTVADLAMDPGWAPKKKPRTATRVRTTPSLRDANKISKIRARMEGFGTGFVQGGAVKRVEEPSPTPSRPGSPEPEEPELELGVFDPKDTRTYPSPINRFLVRLRKATTKQNPKRTPMILNRCSRPNPENLPSLPPPSPDPLKGRRRTFRRVSIQTL